VAELTRNASHPPNGSPPDGRTGEPAKAPTVVTVAVESGSEGQRIDNFLLARIKGVPKSHLYRVLRRGEVRVNKGRVKADYRLQIGDLVRIPPLRTPASQAPARTPDGQLARLAGAVLFEDDRLLVIDKPSGLAVHGGSGLSYGLIESLRQLRPGAELELVHRLDRDTSGCLIVSKRRSTLRDLHALLRAETGPGMDKRYLALILGDLPRPELTVDAPLLKTGQAGGERMVRVDRVEGKPARTQFRLVRRLAFGSDSASLVEVRLLTGRTHQIRVHAAHLGTPLAGDPKYGDFEANRRLKSLGLGRLFLHAWRLSFRADYMQQPLQVESPLPADLTQVLEQLGATGQVREGKRVWTSS
jgi:23S rRNA pseudouridine955/2504/2580 synthase